MKTKYITKKKNQEKITIKKFGKFITTKRGQSFVNNLHHYPLNELVMMYECAYIMMYKSIARIYDLIYDIMDKQNIEPESQNTNHKVDKKGNIDYSWKNLKHKEYANLTKKESKKINEKNEHHKLGRAALMHGYEIHKLDKWLVKHPRPIDPDKEKNEPDIFPETLKPIIEQWEKEKELALERIRDWIASKYDKKGIKHIKTTIKKMNVDEGEYEYWGRYEYFYPDNETNKLRYKIEDRLIAKKKYCNDTIGQSMADYEKASNSNFFVGYFKKDDKKLKAYLPKTGTLYKKYMTEKTNSEPLKAAA